MENDQNQESQITFFDENNKQDKEIKKFDFFKIKIVVSILVIALIIFGIVCFVWIINKDNNIPDRINSGVTKFTESKASEIYKNVNWDLTWASLAQEFPTRISADDSSIDYWLTQFPECKEIACLTKKTSNIVLEKFRNPSRIVIYSKNEKKLIKRYDLPSEFKDYYYGCIILDNENVCCHVAVEYAKNKVRTLFYNFNIKKDYPDILFNDKVPFPTDIYVHPNKPYGLVVFCTKSGSPDNGSWDYICKKRSIFLISSNYIKEAFTITSDESWSKFGFDENNLYLKAQEWNPTVDIYQISLP